VLEVLGGGHPLPPATASAILRSIDKLERIGLDGVKLLLGAGRKDESGDFTSGAGLAPDQIEVVLKYLAIAPDNRRQVLEETHRLVGDTAVGCQGIEELAQIDGALASGGYQADRVSFDPTVVRGLTYYTGPVFEAVLTFGVQEEDGITRQFGSVFGGGRYDDLVERFTRQKVPATGASIGVDRLLAALLALGKLQKGPATAKVLVTRLDDRYNAEYQKIAVELRSGELNTELYVGTQGIGKQFKYASGTGKVVAVIAGEDEMKNGQVSVKDLRMGETVSKELGEDRKAWLEQQPAQVTIPRGEMVRKVREILARYSIG
jgi:histidyl-tRNA synthetase